MRRIIVVLVLALLGTLMLTGASGSGCGQSEPAPSQGGKHRVQPAPNPDPAPTRKGIGNVSLTFWLDQDAHRTVTSYNVGAGPKTHYCNNDCHWGATAKPNQTVTATTDYYALGQKGWLKLSIVQNNNGRILCEDDNSDTGRSGGVTCTGTVVI